MGCGLWARARAVGCGLWARPCLPLYCCINIYIFLEQYKRTQGSSPSPKPQPRARAPSPSPEPRAPSPSGHLFLRPLSGSLLSGNATVARNPYLTRHFSRQNAVYCPFSKKERVFPDWSSLFGPFLGYFQIRNAIFVDFEERNTASVDVPSQQPVALLFPPSFSGLFRLTSKCKCDHCSKSLTYSALFSSTCRILFIFKEEARFPRLVISFWAISGIFSNEERDFRRF